MYIHKSSGARISQSTYNGLSYLDKLNFIPESSNRSSSNGDFLTSAVIGAATGSALLGGLLGGDMLGGILGDSLDGDLWD